jgi:hypothetical protein
VTPAKELPVEVASTRLNLEFGNPRSMNITRDMGDFHDVTIQGKIVAQLNFRDPAGQGVVLYTDQNGVVKSSQFRNDVR